MTDPRILLLSVERSTERRERSVTQLRTDDLDFEIVDAVDGALSLPLPRTGEWGPKLKNTEAACYYTHCRAFQRIVDYNWEHAILLEDDFRILHPHQLSGILSSLPSDCDCLFLHHDRWRNPPEPRETVENSRFVKLKDTFHCTTGQAISRRLAEHIIAHRRVCDRPVDHLLSDLAQSEQPKFNFYELTEPIIGLCGWPSLIHSSPTPPIMNEADVPQLYELLRPHIDKHFEAMWYQHRIIGNKDRINIHGSSYVNDALLNVHSGSITIDEQTFFGNEVALHAGTHNPDVRLQARREFPSEGCDIVIGKGVWIASRAMVLGPCRIGDHAVIAAGAVVTGDVPPGTLYGGIPARFIRKLTFDEDTETV